MRFVVRVERRSLDVSDRCTKARASWHRRMVRRGFNLARLERDNLSWLFVLGINNSGTTLLDTLLGEHEQISQLPEEGQRLSRALSRPNPMKVRRLWTERLDAFRMVPGSGHGLSASRLTWDWLAHHPADRRLRYLMEKSPPNTVRGTWLQHHFGPTAFLALTRSPYAVAEGIRRREGCTIERAARHWTVANTILLDDLVELDNAMLLSYEELCANPSEQMNRITRFLGTAPYADACLEQPLDIHNAEDEESPIRNFNDSSFERLSADELRKIEDIAGDLMSRLGYEFFTG